MLTRDYLTVERPRLPIAGLIYYRGQVNDKTRDLAGWCTTSRGDRRVFDAQPVFISFAVLLMAVSGARSGMADRPFRRGRRSRRILARNFTHGSLD